MKVVVLYDVVLTNELSEVCAVYHFFNREDAVKNLDEMHAKDLEMLENEDIPVEQDDFNEGVAYTIYYGSEYLYRGQIVHSVLKMEE